MKENPNSMANGRKRGSTFWPHLIFLQQILLKPSFILLILSFYFTMVLGHYSRISSLFIDL